MALEMDNISIGNRESTFQVGKALKYTTTSIASFSGKSDNLILFRHPGYPEEVGNILLRLYAFDRKGGGLHYGTAFVACAIVAGNAWNGYFTHQRDGDKIQLGNDDLLNEKSYYFHVPPSQGDSYIYPVCPSFEHWPFPHNNLPPLWANTPMGRGNVGDADDVDDFGVPPTTWTSGPSPR
jgi:hypothetical protein